MKRVLFFLQMLFVVLAYFLHAAYANADENPAAPPAAVAPATGGKSDLDDEMPPDVRARLSQDQLHQIMMERAKRPVPNSEPPAVAIVVPAIFFAVVFAIVVAALYSGYRKDRQRHETLRIAIERGANIPPALLVPQRLPRSDLRRGILLLATGLGLGGLLLATNGLKGGAWAASLIPTFLGFGYLIVHKLEIKKGAAAAQNANEPSPIV